MTDVQGKLCVDVTHSGLNLIEEISKNAYLSRLDLAIRFMY